MLPRNLEILQQCMKPVDCFHWNYTELSTPTHHYALTTHNRSLTIKCLQMKSIYFLYKDTHKHDEKIVNLSDNSWPCHMNLKAVCTSFPLTIQISTSILVLVCMNAVCQTHSENKNFRKSIRLSFSYYFLTANRKEKTKNSTHSLKSNFYLNVISIFALKNSFILFLYIHSSGNHFKFLYKRKGKKLRNSITFQAPPSTSTTLLYNTEKSVYIRYEPT